MHMYVHTYTYYYPCLSSTAALDDHQVATIVLHKQSVYLYM